MIHDETHKKRGREVYCDGCEYCECMDTHKEQLERAERAEAALKAVIAAWIDEEGSWCRCHPEAREAAERVIESLP